MYLELQNNELVFSKFQGSAEKNAFLQAAENINKKKWREYKGKVYFSMEVLEQVRGHLSIAFRSKIKLGPRYMAFARRFILSKEPVTIDWYPQYCEIRGQGIPWHRVIASTSYFRKDAVHADSFKKGSWSGMNHLFDLVNGTFPSGLLERVLHDLWNEEVPYHVEQHFSYPAPRFALNAEYGFDPTEAQRTAVHKLDMANNGFAKLPTGFGKTSYVASALIAKKGVKSMFLANQKVLTEDAIGDFKEVFRSNDHVSIGYIGDGYFEPGDITVASIQTVVKSLHPPDRKEMETAEYALRVAEKRERDLSDPDKKKEAAKEAKKARKKIDSLNHQLERHRQIVPFLKDIDLFIVDESQVLGSKQWHEFLNVCPAPYRYTMSATPTRTDGGGLEIVAATGEQRYERSAKDQIEDGRLSDFRAHFTRFDHGMDPELIKQLRIDYNEAYPLFIVHNDIRNRYLCRKTIEWGKEYSVLALVKYLEHGEIVRSMMIDMGMPEDKVAFVHGKTPTKKRRAQIEAFRQGEIPVLIGTKIFDVGFNAKNASKMVRFNAEASEVRETQRAGRTVRKRENDVFGETFDLIDLNSPFFENQSWKRRKLLQTEFGPERVTVEPDTIQGEVDIVGMEELAASKPNETDQRELEFIIDAMKGNHEVFEEEETDWQADDTNIDLIAELQDMQGDLDDL